MPSPKASAARRLSALIRHRGAEDPEAIEAGREWAEIAILETVDRVLATAPPLTTDQKIRIVSSLDGVR